ncbi:uncharacterized protein LOC107883587 isoform X1 [Acyrthosiphon pisum]|uniref:Gustatory receptor n=1 Tax=Acyrthosiphon pisum TaxID=7029 RepID=A0A8R2NST8_ACYPI|nr:uncharacterized protein LOC107883587 isoform X1 [Acyrthosiphon pisum]
MVMATSYFHLINFGRRFCTLNRLWKLLPSGIVALPGGWSSSELTVVMECIRLLHAELSELLRLFSLGYGPVILIYFTFTFIHALVDIFLIIVFDNSSVKLGILSFVFYIQYIMSTLSILCITSWVIKKKKKIISYLRLTRISELPTETKLQVKIFMSQISVYEPNELTAFGFFNLNLNLFMSDITSYQR